jgi:thioredoxin
MSKADFIAKVFDYENKEEWEFIGELPCVIVFAADWCAPCRMMAPVMEELSGDNQGKVDFYKVDTTDAKNGGEELAGAFGVRSIPSILFVPKTGGRPLMATGALPKRQLQEIVDSELLKEN